MKPKPTPSIVQKRDKPRVIGTLTTRSNKPGGDRKRGLTITLAKPKPTGSRSLLKPEDRAALQAIAKRYRVKSLTRFLECCLAAEDRKGSEQVLFRIYED